MVLIDLFISFLKIGFTSFGGLSMIPLITSEMTEHSWMTASEVSDIVAIAEMTPGPLGLNCATFAGMRTAGIAGAVAANLGALAPTLTVCLAAAIFFEVPVGEKTTVWMVSGFMRAKLRKNPALRGTFCGIGLSDRCFRAGIAAGIASSRNACG